MQKSKTNYYLVGIRLIVATLIVYSLHIAFQTHRPSESIGWNPLLRYSGYTPSTLTPPVSSKSVDGQANKSRQILSAITLPLVNTKGEVTDTANKIFSLSAEEKDRIGELCQSTLLQVSLLERKNAKIRAQNDSGTAIVVKGFPDEGARLLESFNTSLTQILGQERQQDWSYAFAPTFHSVFSDFGAFDHREYIVSYIKDGSLDIDVSTYPLNDGPIIGEKLRTDKIPDRFAHLIKIE